MRINIYQPQAIHELGKRDNQEDCIYPALGQATTATRLFMVCDGMGGHSHGEVASQAVCQAMSDTLTPVLVDDKPLTDDMLDTALLAAYNRLDECDDKAVRKMGTTLTLLALHGGGITVAHIGDSRIYHIRPSERRILYRSRDHSLVMELFQVGEITLQQMATSPQRNIITRAMQPGEENRVRADITHITDIKPGDVFVLCSDGITEQMPTDQKLMDIVCEKGSDEDKCQQLINDTADNSDNHTAYIIHVESVTSQPQDAGLTSDEATVRHNLIKMVPALASGSDVTSRYMSPATHHVENGNDGVSYAQQEPSTQHPLQQADGDSRKRVTTTQHPQHQTDGGNPPVNDYPQHALQAKRKKSPLIFGLLGVLAAITLGCLYFALYRSCNQEEIPTTQQKPQVVKPSVLPTQIPIDTSRIVPRHRKGIQNRTDERLTKEQEQQTSLTKQSAAQQDKKANATPRLPMRPTPNDSVNNNASIESLGETYQQMTPNRPNTK